ncbi:VCBS repeat-containing protein [Archangium minus]|uniref:VCBS repeat-containing protein n=1 Tax=Archangium minus TaxID=83450 RepID=A0ABY9X0T6_9BACT|nr:VCBS repeat-containing protein [Archangium minus]
MSVKKVWGKWARVGLLVSAGLYTGCHSVDEADSEVARPEPLPPGDVSPETPGEPGSISDSGGEGAPPDAPPAEPEPDTGTGGGTQPPLTESDSRRAWLRASFYAGVAPRGLAVGDFNGDGSPDVAVNAAGRNFTSRYVSGTGEFLLLLNDGSGGLGTVSARRILSRGSRIAAGDAEGDGDLDVLVGTRQGARLWVGNGNGTFSEQAVTVGNGLVSSLGFWSGSSGAPLVWALGNYSRDDGTGTEAGFGLSRHLGDGRFESTSLLHESGSQLIGLLQNSLVAAVADYNEDGFADVVFDDSMSRGGQTAHVFFGDSTGRVRAGAVLPWTGVNRLYTADFNRDGHADLLTADTHFVRVYLGNGQGAFSEASSVEIAQEVSDVAVVDLGSDNLPDVVALHGAAGTVSLLRGAGEGKLAPHSQLAVGRDPSAAATADLDGNGTPELLIAEADDNAVSVYAIPTEPVQEPPVSSWCPLDSVPTDASVPSSVSPLAEVDTGGAISMAAVGDFDGDGRRDLALALPTLGARLVLNPGDGTFTTWDVLKDYPVSMLTAGDFDGDGRSDLAGALYNGSDHDVTVVWNDVAAPFENRVSLGVAYGAGGVLAADFNRDGLVDLAASFPGFCIGRAERFTNLGNGTFSAVRLKDYNYEPDDSCPSIGAPLAGDFNGDGTLDLIHTTLGINLNPTSADGSSLPGYGFVGRGLFLGISDVNGDGRVDLVQQVANNGGVRLFLGDGRGSLLAPVQCPLAAGRKTIALEDLNADGLTDVASTSADGTGLWVALGKGQGGWNPPRSYVPGAQVEWVKPVDLVGDKRPELLILLRSGRLLVFPTPAN